MNRTHRNLLGLALLCGATALAAEPRNGAGLDCTEAHLKPAEQSTCLVARRGRLERELGAIVAGLRESIERDQLIAAGRKAEYLAAVGESQRHWEAGAATTCALIEHAWAASSGEGKELAMQRCQVDALAARIADLTRLTGAAPVRSMVDVPVEVSYRKALLGPGLVVSLNSTAQQPLTVKVTMLRGASGAKAVREFTLAPGSRTEIGHAEGLPFATGDEVVIEHPEYRTVRARLED